MATYYIGNIPCSSDDVWHHGILGMKWGIRRFQRKDGSLTAAGKKRYGTAALTERAADENSKSSNIAHTLVSDGFVKDPVYGNYLKSSKFSNGVRHTIEVDLESGASSALPEKELHKIVSDLKKNRDSIDAALRKSIADRIVNDPFMLETAYQGEQLTSDEKRKKLIENLGKQETHNYNDGLVPGYIHWRIMANGLGEIGYDDGGAYGDHYLIADIDWRTKRISKYISVNG